MRLELVIDEMPREVQTEIMGLNKEAQSAFLNQFLNARKKLGLAYLSTFFLASHYAYLGKILTQFIFWLTLGGFGIWWLIDWIRMPNLVKKRNAEIAVETVAFAKMMSNKDLFTRY